MCLEQSNLFPCSSSQCITGTTILISMLGWTMYFHSFHMCCDLWYFVVDYYTLPVVTWRVAPTVSRIQKSDESEVFIVSCNSTSFWGLHLMQITSPIATWFSMCVSPTVETQCWLSMNVIEVINHTLGVVVTLAIRDIFVYSHCQDRCAWLCIKGCLTNLKWLIFSITQVTNLFVNWHWCWIWICWSILLCILIAIVRAPFMYFGTLFGFFFQQFALVWPFFSQ
jgi:hypothetical protein